jgi:hypothetical protein
VKTEYAALAARIRQALVDLEKVTARAEMLYAQAQRTGDDGYLDGVALNLHGFYGGVERIFEDIARTVDHSVPSGPEWHRDLLMQLADEVTSLRPAVITAEARLCLDDYRGFRHVVRNVYTFNLRPSRVRDLVETLRPCFESVRNSLFEFTRFLDQLATTSSS